MANSIERFNNTAFIKSQENLRNVLQDAPKELIIVDAFTKANSVVNNSEYQKILCSISGGSDSDVMLDLLLKVDIERKIEFWYFNTGLEYNATKEHIEFLQKKYGIEIHTARPEVPIPLAVSRFGVPLISKQVSEFVWRLQSINFDWKDRPYKELLEKWCVKATPEEALELEQKVSEGKKPYIGKRHYAKRLDDWYAGQISALDWWANAKGNGSHFNIGQNKWLKEFMILNPPTFKVANKCCQYAKKDVAHKLVSENKFDCSISGVRKAEGGARAAAYSNCYTHKDDKVSTYRPLFWFKNEDKTIYEEHYGVRHSRCYTNYHLKRTGCCACPCANNFEEELLTLQKHEPKLYNACMHVFGESYEYMRKYRKFQKEMNYYEKNPRQLSLADFGIAL